MLINRIGFNNLIIIFLFFFICLNKKMSLNQRSEIRRIKNSYNRLNSVDFVNPYKRVNR